MTTSPFTRGPSGTSSPSGILTLLSDFGLQDVYVGVMKGAIAQIAPGVTVIDLTHQIPPQDVAAARFALLNAYDYFPAGTVHVAVVDPGVGSRRRAIALHLDTGFLVGPDNGLFSGILDRHAVAGAVVLDRPRYWLTPTPSQTFHGRDIFAPVGAALAIGTPLEKVGTAIDPATLVRVDIPPWRQDGQRLHGVIQAIDRFGNVITTIPGSAVAGQPWAIACPFVNAANPANSPQNPAPNPAPNSPITSSPDQDEIPGVSAYADVAIGNGLALVGSHGWVELAVNQGSAQQRWQCAVGDPIQVVLKLQGR